MSAKIISCNDTPAILCQSNASRSENNLMHFFLEHADLGRDWLDDVHPDDRANLKRLLEGQLRGETPSFNIQFRRMHLKTGEWVWLFCRATVIESAPDGTALRIVGTDTDITEIKRDEENLARLNDKMQLAIDASGIGIWEFDLNSHRVHWDDRVLAIYGLEPGQNDRSGDAWAEFIHPDDADDAIAYTEECEITRSDIKYDFRIIRPDGEVRHLRTMARYVDVSEDHTKLIGEH